MKIKVKRTNSTDADFGNLVFQLDEFLAILNGEENTFFTHHNKTDLIKHVIVAYGEEKPYGCGAIKEYKEGIIEIKRMFVCKDKRGLGIATKILDELEQWAIELGYKKSILETSKDLNSAISLYLKKGYKAIPNYDPYKGIENSICFEKELVVKDS